MRVLNLEHDLCLATEEMNFIPPKAVVEFARRCRWLERFMRGPEGEQRRIVPWGWNLQLRERLLKEGVPEGELPTVEELEFIKENSRREFAQQLLEFLSGIPRIISSCSFRDCILTADSWSCDNSIAGDSILEIISPGYRIVAHSLQEIEDFLQEKGKAALKSPLSGSGKGIRFVTKELMETDRGWCRRTLESQGTVIVEERLDVVQEFAMLFEAGDSGIKFLGYSMFYAYNGAYMGNMLASNGYLEEKLVEVAANAISRGSASRVETEIFGKPGVCVSRKTLEEIRKKVAGFLQERLCGRYSGFLGVDMFLFRDGEGRIMVNPAVEINLRMTMGLIARNIFDYHREEFQLGEGTHCFEPERGIFPAGDIIYRYGYNGKWD